MAFQFRCVIPDKPPLTELFVRDDSRVSPTEKRPPPRSLKDLLEMKLGEIAGCPELWPRFELKFDRDSARVSKEKEEREEALLTSVVQGGGSNDSDLEDAGAILESPVTPANKKSKVLDQSVHKASVYQFLCDESPQWSDSMATPPVKWEMPVTPKGNCSETSVESTVDSQCDQTENFTNLAASQELSVGTSDVDILDVDEFLFGDTSSKQKEKEVDTAQSMFTNSTDSPVGTHSEQEERTPPNLCEEYVNFGNLSTARSLVRLASPIREFPATQSRLELFEPVPLAESTPLTHVHTGASPVLFDSTLNVTEADDKEIKGTHSSKKSQNTVTPLAHTHCRAKPRRLSLSKAFAYPTSSQIRCRGEEVSRPSHQYLTRLTKKRNRMSNTDNAEDKSGTLPDHVKLDIATRPMDNETTDPQVNETPHLKRTKIEESSTKMKERYYLPDSNLLLGATTGSSVSQESLGPLFTIHVGGSLTRKRPSGGFKAPRPTKMTKSKALVNLGGKSSNSNEIRPLAVAETTPPVCFKTASGKNLHISDAALTKAKALIERAENDIALDGGCETRTVDGRGTPSVTGRLQTVSGSEISVSSDLAETSDARHPSVVKSEQRLEHHQGFQTASRKRTSVSAASMAMTSQRIESTDMVDALKNSMDPPHDTKKLDSNSVQFGGFQTGSGKPISVSSSSMAKAKRLMESIDHSNETHKTGIESTLTSCSTLSDFGNNVQGNGSLREVEGSFQGFQTGSGKAISVSARSVAKAKHIFESLHLTDSGIVSGETGHETRVNKFCILSDLKCCIRKIPSHKEAQEDCRASVETKQKTGTSHKMVSGSTLTVGFQTAAGKPLHVTAESLAKAKQLVQELDESKDEVSELESKAKGDNQAAAGVPVNLSDSEAQELAEACVADEMISLDSDCLCDDGMEPGNLDLSVFTQYTSWEIRESMKALLHSSSQDSDQTIPDGTSGDDKLMAIQESNSLVVCSHGQNTDSNTRDGAIGLMECKMTEHGENSASKELLLTDSVLQDTNEELDAHASQSSSISMGELNGQPEKLGKYENCEASTSEQLRGEVKHAELALDDSSFNAALLSEPLETVERSESIVETCIVSECKPPGQDPVQTNISTPVLDNYNITTISINNSIPDVKTSTENVRSKQHGMNAFPGFFTAAGNRVEVSDEALAKAKATLNDISCHTSSDCQNTFESNVSSVSRGFSGLQTASGQTVTVSEEALDAVRQHHMPAESPSFVGFQTASGRNVAVSEDALQQAKKLLSNDHNTVLCVESTSTTGNQSAPPHNNIHPPNLSDNSEAVVPRVGFQTAAGDTVEISKKSLQEARHWLDDDQIVTSYGSKLADSHLPHAARQPQTAGSSDQVYSYSPYRRTMSTGVLVRGAEHQSGFSLRSTLKPLRSSITEMTRDCRAPLGAVGRRPIQTQSGRDFGSSSFKSCQTWNPPPLPTDNLLLSRDAQNGSSSVFSYPLAAPAREEKNNDYHTPFLRHNVTNMSNHYKPSGNVEKPRPSRPAPMFKTPYKKNAKVSTHHAVSVESDKTPCQTRKQPVLFTPTNSRQRCKSNIQPDMDSRLEEKEKQETCDKLQREQKIEVTAVTQDNVSPSTLEPGHWTGTVRPCLGSWLKRRLEAPACRRSLCDLSRLHALQTYTTEELIRLGVHLETLSVSSCTAGDFRFRGEVHFSRAVLTGNHAVRLRDGGQLQLDKSGKAGVEEFIKVMSSTPGVDTKLISDEWICNHYRWIVWKLAAMEVAFPSLLAGRCLTPECVASQLKYRYDREVDRSERSCLKKIYEKDDVASRRMILCVAAIDTNKLDDALRIIKTRSLSRTRKSTDKDSSYSTKETMSSVVVELTDGWYSIRAEFDEPLLNMVKCEKIVTGTKLCIYGAELCGLTDACPPLEAPTGVFLRVHANSTRRAVWYAKLGYQSCSKAFPVSLSSLYSCGGLVGCVDILIQRQYPLQWMERTGGMCVFRSTRAEEKVARKHDEAKQKRWEATYERLEKDTENEWNKDSFIFTRGLKVLSSKDIAGLDSGEDINDALLRSSDPATLEAALSVSQRRMLENYRQQSAECRRGQLWNAVNQALEESDNNDWKNRSVVGVMRLRVSCCLSQSEGTSSHVLLSVWRPSEELVELLAENKRFRIFNLTASQYSVHNGSVQLSTTRATCYREVEDRTGTNNKLFHSRTAVSVSDLSSYGSVILPPFGEFDTVGVVVSIRSVDAGLQHRQSHKSPMVLDTVFLADEEKHVLAVKFWGGILRLAVDSIVRPKAVVAMANLRWCEGDSSVRRGIPCAMANELTIITSLPKERYLQIAVEQLQASLPADFDEFICAFGTSMSQLPLHGKPKRSHSSVDNSSFQDEMDDPEIEQWAMTADLQSSLQTVILPSTQRSRQKDTSFLDRVPSPPPLASLPVPPLSVVCQDFKQPKKSSQ